MTHLLADALQLLIAPIAGTHLDDGDIDVRNRGKNALLSFGRHDRAEHLVPFDEPIPRILETSGIGGVHFSFRAEERGDPAEDEVPATSDPVGLLHVGQGEGLEALLRAGDDPRSVNRPVRSHGGGEFRECGSG